MILENGVLAVRITRELFERAVASGDFAVAQSTLAYSAKKRNLKLEISIV